MAEETRMPDHLDLDTIVEYVEMALSEEQARPVELHLARCDTCTELARDAQELSSLWDGWTARTHAEAALSALMSSAVEQAVATTAGTPAMQARLARWAERWSGGVEAAVRVVVGAAGEASRVVTEGLDAIARPGTAWQFSLVPAPTPTRGARGRGAAPSQPTVAVAAIGGAAQARVAVSGERRELVVRLDGLPVDEVSPLILLVPLGGTSEAQPERQPGIAYLIARFEQVPAGEYLVAFEPQSP